MTPAEWKLSVEEALRPFDTSEAYSLSVSEPQMADNGDGPAWGVYAGWYAVDTASNPPLDYGMAIAWLAVESEFNAVAVDAVARESYAISAADICTERAS